MQCSPRKLCCSQKAGGFKSIHCVCVKPVTQHAAGLSSCFKHGACRQQPPALHSMVKQKRHRGLAQVSCIPASPSHRLF